MLLRIGVLWPSFHDIMLTVANRGNNFDVNGDYDNWRSRSRDHSIRKKPRGQSSSPSAHRANSSDRRKGGRNERLAKWGQKDDPNEQARILGGILSKININPNNFALFKEAIETRLEQFAHDVNLINYALIVSKFFCSSGQNFGRLEKSHTLSPEQQDFMVSILGRAAHKMQFDNTENMQVDITDYMQALTNLIYALVYIDYDSLSEKQKNKIKELMDQVAKKIEKTPAQDLNKQDFILASIGCSNLPTELVEDFLTLLNDKLAESKIKLAPNDFCSLLISYACHEDLLQGFFDKHIYKLDTEGKWSSKTLIFTLDKLSKIHNNKAFFSLLNTLKDKIINYPDNFNFEDLATVLKLASSIGPDFVQELLPRMNKDLQETNGSLNRNQLGPILFSIAQCDPSDEINSLLKIVSEKLPKEQEPMIDREISQSFGGLRNHEFAVPDKLWSFLKDEFLSLKDSLNKRSLNSILLATQNHKEELPKSIFSEAAKILLEKVKTRDSLIDQSTKYFSQLARILRSPQIDKQQAKIVIDYFKNIPSKIVLGIGFKRELHLLAFLRPELKDDLAPLISQKEFLDALSEKQSTAEQLAGSAISQILPNIKAGQYINGIELDFYDEESKINIEIDGVFHQGCHKFEDAIRDEYLNKVHGVQVFRIKLPKDSEIDPGDNYLVEASKAIDAQLSKLKPKRSILVNGSNKLSSNHLAI